MPKKSSKKVSQGPSALASIIRSSKDQAIGAVKQRYLKGGLSQVKADVAALRRLMNTEEKHVDTLTTVSNLVNTVSIVQAIGTMAQGSTSSTRTGNSIKVNRIDVILHFQLSNGTPATTAYQTQVFNWYIVKYLKTASSSGATAFAIADFLNTDANGNVTPLSLPNPDLNENFQVMGNGEVVLNLDVASTVTSAVSKLINIRVDRVFHQTYSSTTAASIVDNMCFLVFTALQPLNAGGVSNVQSSVRMWYIDN